MKLPQGMTEAEVVDAISRATSALARTFKFGPYDEDDIKQEGAIEAITVINKGVYDPRPGPDGKPTRPLANFLYVHIRNRIMNLRRQKLRRNDPPCRSCHEALGPGQTAHADGQYCEKYQAWLTRNTSKANILCPLDLSNINDEHESRTKSDSNVEFEVERDEMLALVDQQLPVELRTSYLQMRSGKVLPKAVREKVEQAVLAILKGAL